MNDITEVDRLNAKIADLKRTIEWLQGRTGIVMGAAARAEIAAAPDVAQLVRFVEMVMQLDVSKGLTPGQLALVHGMAEAALAVAPVQQQEPGAGLEAAAALIDKKVADYDRDHGNTDPDTGTREYPGDGAEWIGQMEELAEEIRFLKSAAATVPSAE